MKEILNEIDKLFDDDVEEEKEKEKENKKINESDKDINITKSDNYTNNKSKQNETLKNKDKDNNNIFNKFKDMKNTNPIQFYSIIIGSIIGLIIVIVVLNTICKYCKSYKRKGYISHMDSDVGKSNKISATGDI